jgi:hypothetical protein
LGHRIVVITDALAILVGGLAAIGQATAQTSETRTHRCDSRS